MTLPQIRCPQCDKRLFDGLYLSIEVRCNRCGCQSRHQCRIDNFAALVTLIGNALRTDSRSLVQKKETREAHI